MIPKPLLMQATSNMLCSITFGKQYDYNDSEFRQLLSMIEQRPQLTDSGLLLAPFLFRNRKTALMENLREGFCFVGQIIEDHKEDLRKNDECKDYIDLYLKNIEQKKNEDDSEKQFTEKRLNILMDMFFIAGADTSSNTLAWCLLRLIADPDMQQQIREEILEACGEHRLPTYSDRSRMPFTEAFLLEVQRLHTVLPLGECSFIFIPFYSFI